MLTVCLFAFLWFGNDKAVPVTAIVQTGLDYQVLTTAYFAEILGLSKGESLALLPEDAKGLLMKSPLLKKADVALLPDGVLYIDYEARKPLFALGDVENAAVDDEGVCIPLDPFYTPKNLSFLYVSHEVLPSAWGQPIDETIFQRAKDICSLFPSCEEIDVSRLKHKSLGKRELIVRVDGVYLRLSSFRDAKEAERFKVLKKSGLKDVSMIDLRLDHLAYLTSKEVH